MNLNKHYAIDMLEKAFADAFDEDCFECKHFNHFPARDDEPESEECGGGWRDCPKVAGLIRIVKEEL